jgi:hypothetical protein
MGFGSWLKKRFKPPKSIRKFQLKKLGKGSWWKSFGKEVALPGALAAGAVFGGPAILGALKGVGGAGLGALKGAGGLAKSGALSALGKVFGGGGQGSYDEHGWVGPGEKGGGGGIWDSIKGFLGGGGGGDGGGMGIQKLGSLLLGGADIYGRHQDRKSAEKFEKKRLGTIMELMGRAEDDYDARAPLRTGGQEGLMGALSQLSSTEDPFGAFMKQKKSGKRKAGEFKESTKGAA